MSAYLCYLYTLLQHQVPCSFACTPLPPHHHQPTLTKALAKASGAASTHMQHHNAVHTQRAVHTQHLEACDAVHRSRPRARARASTDQEVIQRSRHLKYAADSLSSRGHAPARAQSHAPMMSLEKKNLVKMILRGTLPVMNERHGHTSPGGYSTSPTSHRARAPLHSLSQALPPLNACATYVHSFTHTGVGR